MYKTKILHKEKNVLIPSTGWKYSHNFIRETHVCSIFSEYRNSDLFGSDLTTSYGLLRKSEQNEEVWQRLPPFSNSTIHTNRTSDWVSGRLNALNVSSDNQRI